MKYKYELHCHTSEVSMCGQVSAKDAVKMYADAGYNGIVITDHYSPLTFMQKGRHYLSPQKDINFYLSGYEAALSAAPSGFTVLLGMELRFYATGNDYLLYGIDESFIRNNGNLLLKTPRTIHNIAQNNGYLFVQAHPYRSYIIRIKSNHLDGAEVFNGKGDHNDKAEKWAERKHIKIRTSGSDFHKPSDFGKGGIITDNEITSNKELIYTLNEGKYTLIKNDCI